MTDGSLRSILITGSSSGIGAATARRLAGPGTGVMLHARRNREGAERVAAELREKGAEVAIAMGDLAEPEVGGALVEQAVAAFGGLDVLVANAGFPVMKGYLEVERAELDYAFAAIMGGFFQMTQAAAKRMAEGRDGRIVAVSTLNAHVFRAGFPVYPASGAAKAGLEALVKTLAIELAPRRITVNCVAPGLITKDANKGEGYAPAEQAALLAQVPLGRMGAPAEVAALIAFLASREAGYITGQVVHVDGGMAQ